MDEHIAPQPNINPARGKREKRPPKKITPSYLYNSGLAYLQRFPASTAHFKTIMMKKITRSCRHHTDQDKESCLAMLQDVTVRFIDMGVLNDAGYLAGMVRSLRRRGLSSSGIVAKLTLKGLSAAVIRDALTAYDDEHICADENGDMGAALRLAFRKRIGPFRKNNARKTPEQELALLARHGYGFDTAQKILAMDRDEAEEKIRQAE